MKKLAVFLLLLMIQSSLAQEKKPFSIGETVTVFSEILKEGRTLNIYLPQGYTDSEKKYPVIYLLDGSSDEDFIHIAGLVQFGSFSWINMLPESIVVGIANVDRKRDFTFPTQNEQDKKEFPTTGGSEKFIQFLEKELQPYIQENYKVNDEKTIIGQSLGGLLATEILFKKPELFNNYIIVSPSMWWDQESLLSLTPQMPSSEKKIYIAVGSEGPTMETGAIKLRYTLQKYYATKALVYFNFLESQNHGDALHLAVYDAFEKIFKAEMK